MVAISDSALRIGIRCNHLPNHLRACGSLWKRGVVPCFDACNYNLQSYGRKSYTCFIYKNSFQDWTCCFWTKTQYWELNFIERKHSRNVKARQCPRFERNYSSSRLSAHWIYCPENRYLQSFVLTPTNPLTIKGFVSSANFIIPTLYPSVVSCNRLSTSAKNQRIHLIRQGRIRKYTWTDLNSKWGVGRQMKKERLKSGRLGESRLDRILGLSTAQVTRSLYIPLNIHTSRRTIHRLNIDQLTEVAQYSLQV